MLEKFNETKAAFLTLRDEQRKNNIGKIVSDEDFQYHLRLAGAEFNPQVKNHKDDIIRWMTFWPFSFAWTMLSDPIRKAFRHIFYAIQGTLQRISDKMFAKANMNLSGAAPEPSPNVSFKKEVVEKHDR